MSAASVKGMLTLRTCPETLQLVLPVTFSALVAVATADGSAGSPPYAYQQRLADEGLPEVLDVPTGCGKTLAAVLPWVWRGLLHPDKAVRQATPRRLVVVLPMRTLVEQTADVAETWLRRLALDVPVVRLLGGDSASDGSWRLHPERRAVLVGTQDMVLSRSLLRGYGCSRYSWAVDAGLLNNDCAYVFDEVQLAGPALPTGRQLQGLRERLGTVRPCTSTWMSATVDLESLVTVDNPTVGTTVTLDAADEELLGPRLRAGRRIQQAGVDTGKDYEADLAEHVRARARPGERTIVVVNTVRAARSVAARLTAAAGQQVVLLHSRFRPGDRRRQLAAALAKPPPQGLIVVATQVLEAGVDVTSSVLVTEVAPWSSIVQRAGRLNRDGAYGDDAELWWVQSPHALPYDEADVEASALALRTLEGEVVTSRRLRGLVPPRVAEHAVLRRKDLVELFDTTAELTGEDIDISRWIRDGDDHDVSACWRVMDGEAGEEEPVPTAAELCPVPVSDLRQWLKDDRPAWLRDPLERGWRRIRREDVRPGLTVLLAAASGGYDAEGGWDPSLRALVAPVLAEVPDAFASRDDLLGGEVGTTKDGRWVTLQQHLDDARREAEATCGALEGMPATFSEAVVRAAALHDLGKAHPAFQQRLMSTTSAEPAAGLQGQLWAKSAAGRGGTQPRERRALRHELVTALMLLEHPALLEDVAEPSLVVYLAAAHHGRVRLGARSAPDEPEGFLLGVRDGEEIPALWLTQAEVAPTTLRLDHLRMGAAATRPSYTAAALALRDRADLGPLRLAYLEALVRMADWRASAKPSSPAEATL